MSNQQANQNEKTKELFSLFKSAMSSCFEDGCCNMKIMSKDDIADESGIGRCCNMPTARVKEKKGPK